MSKPNQTLLKKYGLLPAVTGTGGTSYGMASPVILYAKSVTVGTSGSPADIATITVPAGITRYVMVPGSSTNGGGMKVYAETASGTLAGATFQAFDTSGGGGTALTNTVSGPTAAAGMTAVGASSALIVYTSSTIYIRQTVDSANAGTLSFYITIWPLP